MKSLLRRRLSGPVLAAALLVGAAVFPSAALAQREVDGWDIQCVYYTETAGSCVASTHYSDGTVEFRWYLFWGNSYVSW